MILLLTACFSSSPPAPRSSTPPSSSTPVRFIALGDVGKISSTQRKVGEAIGRVCAGRPCDFGLLLGDNLYPKGMESDDDPRMDQAFTEMYGDLGLVFHAVLGNHDYGLGERARAERQIAFGKRTPSFHMPDFTYTFVHGDAAFFALDTDDVFFNGHDAQAAWLDAHLEADDHRWKVVFGHHPYRSNGKHGNAGQYEGWANVPYLSGNALFSLFEDHVKGRADLYVSGHDHNLQAMVHEGLPLIVSGSGGSAREMVDRGNDLLLGHAVPGFAWVELGERLTIETFDEHGQSLGSVTLPHPRAEESIRSEVP